MSTSTIMRSQFAFLSKFGRFWCRVLMFQKKIRTFVT